jgi:hypothetical protein
MKLKLPGGMVVNTSKAHVRVSSRANYGVTPLGRVKAEEGAIPGNKGRVLAAVESLSFSEPVEIAQEVNLSLEQTKHILKYLIKKGYVQQEYEGD